MGEDTGRELWQSDGTPGGTKLVADIHPGPGDSHPAELTPVGRALYFSADDGTRGRELWKRER
jgi:ELWxxDGT repeat protein